MSLPLGRKNVAVFDEHRNSSRVWPVPPTALPEAVEALARFKASQPDLYGWVASGAPLLSHGQHAAIFGERLLWRCRRAGRLVLEAIREAQHGHVWSSPPSPIGTTARNA